ADTLLLAAMEHPPARTARPPRGGPAPAMPGLRRFPFRAAGSSKRKDLFLPPPASYRSRRHFFLDPVVTFFFQLESQRFIAGHHQPAVHHHMHVVRLDVIQQPLIVRDDNYSA